MSFGRRRYGRDGHSSGRGSPSAAVVRPVRGVCRRLAGLSAPAVIISLFIALYAYGGEIEPRAYVNTPVGVNFLLAGYAYTDGGLSLPGSVPLQGAQLFISTEILAYARTLDVWGRSGKFDIIVPYSELSGHGTAFGRTYRRRVSGFADPQFRFSVNLYGAPALSVEEFKGYQQDLIVGTSVQVSAPLGQYDRDKLVNLGNNRWFVKPDIGVSKAWGPFTLELSGGAYFFTNNNEYYMNSTLKQDPLLTAQVHGSYNFGRGVWAALSWSCDYAGRTTINGVRSEDAYNNTRAGATLALPINRRNSIKFFASTSLHTTVGTDFNMVGVAWQHRWGSGL